ncbi:hypothetical protein BYT27DRAFT_7243312 [Phlegmacium glaucopus]|nr:hypothetical protein BYT27DRAFT_7243312 [Phlegmacium glaucopus]
MHEIGRTCQINISQRRPLDNICEALEAYFHFGFNDKQLEEYLRDHYDTESYGLGTKSIKRYIKELGLLSTRQQKQTSESIASTVAASPRFTKMFPSCGKTIRKTLAM